MNFKEHFKAMFSHQGSRAIGIAFAVAISVLIIFQLGVFVGYRKASFAYRFGDNYSRAFGGSGRMMGSDGFFGADFSGGHGSTGKIVRLSLPTLVIADRDNTEKVITVSDQTIIRNLRQTAKPGDLKVGDWVVVIGAPNDQAQIEAKLIRRLPAVNPLSATSSNSR